MKVLYISNYLDGTGWSNAAIEYILALDSVGVNVVPRAIKLNNAVVKPPQKILDLEKKDIKNPDVVIQQVLPHQLEYNGRIDKNIALYFTETSNFKSNSWAEKINNMDLAVVANQQSIEASIDSGVEIPIASINIPVNISKFLTRNIAKIPNQIKPNKDAFVFYTVGEFNKRKNLADLLKAFHTEFDYDENVELLIKTTPVGIQGIPTVENFCNEVKAGLKKYTNIKKYKKEIIITNYLSTEQLNYIHSECDCFVSASYGEAWCMPAFDALGFGKTPIVTGCTGFLDYINNNVGWLVDCYKEPVFGMIGGFPDMYTSKEDWWKIDINHLRKCMREAYENKSMRRDKIVSGINYIQKFDHKVIGAKFKKIIGG